MLSSYATTPACMYYYFLILLFNRCLLWVLSISNTFRFSFLVSPSLLSPVSTAPTIPDAPMSDIEDVDYYRGTYQSPITKNRPKTPTNPHTYKKEYIPGVAEPMSRSSVQPRSPRSHSPYPPREASPGGGRCLRTAAMRYLPAGAPIVDMKLLNHSVNITLMAMRPLQDAGHTAVLRMHTNDTQ